MVNINIDLNESIGKIKPMHCVNNGPIHKKGGGQERSNLKEYADAGIPYARNHDASFCANYGGSHTVDVHSIFPNFDADENDENSYDFTLTDLYNESIMSTGTKVFYRLGSKIEHEKKKYGTIMPKDFSKWARICEHIIRHMNEGWANGHHYGIEYWEIWNEPDLDKDDSTDKRCWSGTAKEFYEFFRIAATHLKKCFPDLKIGGPAVCNPNNDKWYIPFFESITKEPRVPLDFFSWHIYTNSPLVMGEFSRKMRGVLDSYGYTKTESILNEWNYVYGWNGTEFIDSILAIIGIKGAAFNSAVMSVCQKNPLDMLMYYDARPSAFNGMFDFYTLRTLKGYYSFLMFNDLYKKGTEVKSDSSDNEVFVNAGKDNDGNFSVLITYFTNDSNALEKEIEVDFAGVKPTELSEYFLDEKHSCENVGGLEVKDGKVKFSMLPNTVVMLKK